MSEKTKQKTKNQTNSFLGIYLSFLHLSVLDFFQWTSVWMHTFSIRQINGHCQTRACSHDVMIYIYISLGFFAGKKWHSQKGWLKGLKHGSYLQISGGLRDNYKGCCGMLGYCRGWRLSPSAEGRSERTGCRTSACCHCKRASPHWNCGRV